MYTSKPVEQSRYTLRCLPYAFGTTYDKTEQPGNGISTYLRDKKNVKMQHDLCFTKQKAAKSYACGLTEVTLS